LEIADLHIITQHIEGFSHLAQIEALKNTEANWIQLRVKDTPQKEWFAIGRKAKEILKDTNIKLIINDNVYLAKEIEADGVHLGKTDMDVSEARTILGENKIIGGTANTFHDIIKLYEMGTDYVGLGPYKQTTTKKDLAPILSLFAYEVIIKKLELQKIKIPIISIGGIQIEDVVPLMTIGLSGVAVSSSIVKARPIQQKVLEFRHQLNKFQFSSSNTQTP